MSSFSSRMNIFPYFREFGVDRDLHRGDVHAAREFLVTEFRGYVVPEGFLRHFDGGPRRFHSFPISRRKMRNMAESAQSFSRPPFYDRPAIACSQACYRHVHLKFKNMFTRPADMCEHVVLYPPSIPQGDKAWIFRAKFMNLLA